MARNHARILTSIWNDADFLALTPEAQRMYFVALSQPTVSYAGVVALTVRRWAKLAKGLTATKVAAAVSELANARFVVVDQETEELWIRSFVKHDGVIDQPGLVVAMAKDYLAIQSPEIRQHAFDRLGPGWLDGLARQFPKAFGDGFPDGFPDGFVDGFRRHFGDGSPNGSGEGSPNGSGEGSPNGSARMRPSSPTPSPTPSSSPRPPRPRTSARAEPAGDLGSATTGLGPAPPGSDDDDRGFAEPGLDPATEAAVEAAIDAQLRERQSVALVEKLGRVADVGAWRIGTRAKILAALARGDRSVLDPPRQGANGGSKGDPGERAAAAQRAIAERNDARLRGESACGKCSDSGVFERDDGSVERCDCATSAATSKPARASA